jgi:hypothetical protein
MAVLAMATKWAWLKSRFRRLWHGPHVHGDRPVRFNGRFPDSGENNLPVGSDQIIVTLRNMRAKPFDV